MIQEVNLQLFFSYTHHISEKEIDRKQFSVIYLYFRTNEGS